MRFSSKKVEKYTTEFWFARAGGAGRGEELLLALP